MTEDKAGGTAEESKEKRGRVWKESWYRGRGEVEGEKEGFERD